MKSRLITKATLLLCARLNDSKDAPRPLSLSEYHHLAQWLDGFGLTLAALLRPDAKDVLRAYPGADRILRLLRRVAGVEVMLDHWDQLGIWVLGEREANFPARLRQRFKTACLPLLFGAGPVDVLDQGGLCVVGSRDSPEESHVFARAVGSRAGREELVVISSEMRGIDREVISATLASGGRVICVFSDSLEKAVASRRYREALETGRTSLVTPFTPDAHFAVANAIRARRYPYGLSDAAIVVETRQTGGIWLGADENRRQRWVPAFVRTGANVASGNSALLHLGALPITLHDVEHASSLSQLLIERVTSPSTLNGARAQRPDLYSAFLSELARLDEAIASSEDLVAQHFEIELIQARTWLARARGESS